MTRRAVSALVTAAPHCTGLCSAKLAVGTTTIWQYHAESGCGQFEFCLAHEAGVAAADKLLLAREAIVGTAAVAASDIVATFVPK